MSFFRSTAPSEFSAIAAAHRVNAIAGRAGGTQAIALVQSLVDKHGEATPAYGPVAVDIAALLDHVDSELDTLRDRADGVLIRRLPDGYLDALVAGLKPLRAVREFGTEMTLGELVQLVHGAVWYTGASA